jgi:predicted amidophosphoribosyltransferase
MINAFNIVTKLQNRPWVDQEITDLLERLWKYFDQNYHEFTSFEKWKKQVENKRLVWSPVHTEKFWQTSFMHFNEAENLACIDILIKQLEVP